MHLTPGMVHSVPKTWCIRMYIIYSQGGFRLGGMPFTSDYFKLKRFLKRKVRCTGVGP